MLHYFFSGLGQTFLLSLFVASFIESLQISNMQFSWYYSGATLTSAFILPLAGKYLDRVKVRYFSLTIALMLILFSLIIASMQHVLLLAMGLFGLRFCGQGLMILTGSTATARFFHEGRGKALSLVSFGISASEFTLPLLVTGLIAAFGWRMTWVFLAAAVLIFFIPAIIRLIPLPSPYQLPSPEEVSAGSKKEGATRKEVLRDPKFYLLSLVNLWVAFFITGVFIHQNLLASAYGWSLPLMATGISVFGLTRFGANIFLGPVIDQFTATRCFSFVLIPLILGSLLLILTQAEWVVVAFFVLCGISGSLSSLTTTAMWAEVYGTAHLGAIRSVVSTFMVVAAALAPVLVGIGFSQTPFIIPTWWIMIGLMALSTIISFIVVRNVKILKG
ncbi:MAG: MFS transporter [Bacteroidota bacterium]